MIQKLTLSVLLCFCFLVVVGVASGQGPENVLVVVNADSSDSLAVANRYVHLRGIPAVNVVYLRGLPEGAESSNTASFRRLIFKPVLNAISQRGITNQIDCVAYSAGFPTRINFQPQRETYLRQAGKKYNIRLHAPWVSITSLTYFYRNVFSERPDFLEPDANHYANPRGMKVLSNPFVGDDARKYEAAMKNVRARDFDRAIEQLIALARVHREQMAVIYSLARCFAFKGETEKAIASLNHAKKVGFASRSLLLSDEAFSKMRSLPEFKNVASQLEGLPDGVIPTRPFSSQQYWAKNGWPNGNAEQGERYTLSSVLAVTGKNQSTLEASLDRLQASALADGTAPQGNVYFADHKNVRSRTRSRQFPFAVEELESLGHKASIGSGIYPVGDQRVIGATLGSAAPKWAKSKSKFLPGAICDNFTSYGAWWEKTNQTQINEWLDAGAAGASGTVYEPYAYAAKFPNARWHAHYARGCTLAESYYQSVSGPFQLLLMGDPLCCPFGEFPDFEIKGLEHGASVTEDFILEIEPVADSPAVRQYQMYYDGVFLSDVPNPDQIAVATDGMNDGYHELRIVGVADSPIATKRSKKIGFICNRVGQTVNLDLESPRVRIGRKIVGTANASFGTSIRIQQNMRTLTEIRSGETFTIPATQVGMGQLKLRAVVALDDGTLVQSEPVALVVER